MKITDIKTLVVNARMPVAICGAPRMTSAATVTSGSLCLGFEHTKLTYKFQGRNFRLTDVAGNVVQELLA